MSESREDNVYLAKLAEQAERYEGQCLWPHTCQKVYAEQWRINRDGREHEARCFF